MLEHVCFACADGDHEFCMGTHLPPEGVIGGERCICRECQHNERPPEKAEIPSERIEEIATDALIDYAIQAAEAWIKVTYDHDEETKTIGMTLEDYVRWSLGQAAPAYAVSGAQEAFEEAYRLREGLKAVVRIGNRPRNGLNWNRRECERRGQAMMDAANAALNGDFHE